MQDEFDTHLQIPGFLVAGGRRQAATLHLGPTGLEAVVEGEAPVRVLWSRSSLKKDDADGALLIVGKGGTVGSAEPGFLRAIEGAAGNDLDRQLAELQGLPTGWRGSGILGCTVFFALLAVLMISLPGCYERGVDAAVDQLDPAVDAQLGEQAEESMDVGPEVDDEVVTAAIQEMVDRLAPHFEGTDLTSDQIEWHVRVVENEQINAFALPGGYITVFTGLIEAADSPDTVAGILGHEMVHVLQRHGLKNVANRIGIFAGVQLIFGDAGGVIGLAGSLASEATASGMGRGMETEADELGLAATVRAGLDPEALGDFFEMLRREMGDIPLGMRLFASHPDHAARVAALQELIEGMEVPERQPLDVDWADVQRRVAGDGPSGDGPSDDDSAADASDDDHD